MKLDAKKALLIAVAMLVLLVCAMVAAVFWFVGNHFFVGGNFYPNAAEFLNLRDKDLSIAQYEEIRTHYPDIDIYWKIPFQGKRYNEDTKELSVQTLAEEDLDVLAYLPELETVDAVGCQDYDQLVKLQQTRPELKVLYTVSINGKDYDQDTKTVSISSLTDAEVALLAYLPELNAVEAEACKDFDQLLALQQNHPELTVTYAVEIIDREYNESTTALEFKDPDVSVLMSKLAYLPKLETVSMGETSATAESLLELTETYPNVDFNWSKTALGKTYTNKDKEIDYSGIKLSSTDEVEKAMKYYPGAEKVIMSNCGIDNQTMAAFREKMRPEYKAVWTVRVSGANVRTDETTFIPAVTHDKYMINEQMTDFIYCEDMIVVDIGHSAVKEVEWVKGMPNLKYLILADNWLKDISALSSCKNLIYLELFINEHLKDVSPLLGCTALQDLSVSKTYINPEPLAKMTWLKNLWINQTPLTAAQRKLLEESLPNTHIEFDHGWTTGGGWRELQNYYDMRDLLGLPYNAW